MNIIKVLHISPSGILYGTERHILSIVKYADKQKFQHFVVTPNLGNFNELLKNLNIPFFIAGRKPGYKNNLSAVFEIKDVWPLYKRPLRERVGQVLASRGRGVGSENRSKESLGGWF